MRWRAEARGILSTASLIILATIAAISLAGCSDDESPTGPGNAEVDSTWTVIVYDAADGSAVTIFNCFQAIEAAHSGPCVNLLALQDTEDGPAKMLYLDDNNALVLLEELGERNTGSEETLYSGHGVSLGFHSSGSPQCGQRLGPGVALSLRISSTKPAPRMPVGSANMPMPRMATIEAKNFPAPVTG